MATTLRTSGIQMGSSILDVSGSAPSYTCRAWVNFNGTGTVAIRASGNVSSITDLGSCSYRVNLSTAMADGNHATIASMRTSFTSGVAFNSTSCIGSTYSSTQIDVQGVPGGDVGNYVGQAVADTSLFCVAVFR